MSGTILLQIISSDNLSKLKNHMGVYGLAELTPTLGGAGVTGTGTVYSVALGNNFLNTQSTLACGMVTNANNDFLFWLTVNTGTNKFADYFPDILPADPWLAPDPDSVPFPNLASVAIDNMEWRYLFFSTATPADQATLYSSYNDASKPRLDKLQDISGTEHAFDDSIIAWVGGFYYSGSYNFPWALLIPAGIPWNDLVPNIGSIAVNGCTYQQELFSYLKLRVPLLTRADPFGSGVIKNIAFAFELSTVLSAVNETTNNSASGLSVGLSGTIQIGNNTEISVTGTWPLIGDDIIIDATCKLSQINAYFDNTSISGITLPDDITADIAFYFSKAGFSITKINFGLDIEKTWAIAPGIFELQSVVFDVTLISPADANIVLASFNANAKIGGTVSVICSGNYPDGSFSIALDPATPIKLGELVNSISGIPDVFPDGLLLSELSGSYNSDNKFYSLAAAVSDDSPWQPGDTGFSLKGISASVSKGADFNCSLAAVFEIDFTGADGGNKSMLFNVSAIYSASWYFSAGYTGNVSIADVAAAFGFSNIPELLNDCVFTAIDIIFDSGSGFKQLSGDVTVKIDDDANVSLSLQINLLTVNGSTTVSFSGDFTLTIDDKELDFHVDFDKQADGSDDLKFSFLFKITSSVTLKLDAESKSPGGTEKVSEKVSEKFFSGSATGLNVSLTDALNNLIEDIAGISLPVELPDLVLTSIACTYDGKNSATNLIATGTIGERAINFLFYYGKADDQPADQNTGAAASSSSSRYAFGLQADISNLGGLPLVGPQLEDVKISNFGFVYASAPGDYSLPTLATGSGDGSAPASQGQPKTLSKGFNFSGELQLPGEDSPFSLTLSPAPADTAPAAASVPAATNNATAPTSAQDTTKWFKLDKKLGPVTVGQVGFKFADGSLELLISGSLTVASLTISLNGLGVSFVVKDLFKAHINPTFSLAGIGLQYSAPPVEISAAFLHSFDSDHNDVYSGAAIIKASKFTITALGSYAKVQGETSLFIYGLYEGAIGGPIFFFVTGIAAGFGYNRKVNVPSVTEVDSFPLVSLAMSAEDKSLDDILASLNTPILAGNPPPIEISLGDYWLAVGIKFTSFKIIESFVLLTVNFGTQLEFAILGLSKLSWPEKSIMPEPIVYIELAVLAHFGPGSDVISVEAIITSNSYLLSKDCKLTGGFAFYTWVSGPHEGDFVVTLGGYHPKFIKPDYYPTVPRLGLSWKVSDVLMISGEMYYAITPSAIMAGGKWEVLFQIPVLTVNVTVWADMLIYWSPFQYYIDVSICVKIDANINISFIRIHFSLEMDAELHIWGPPFAGEAYVDWTIFSFTIPFGDGDKKDPDPLSWPDFSEGFVPHTKPATVAATALDSLADTPADNGVADPINIMISNGIIDVKTGVNGQDKFAVINPYQLAITVDSFIPVTTLILNTVESSGAVYAGRNVEIGIPPCGLTRDDKVEMVMTVTFMKEGVPQTVLFSPVSKGFTEALWGGTKSASDNNNPGTSTVLQNIISGMAIFPDPAQPPSAVRAYDFSNLFDPSVANFTWAFDQVKLGPAYHAYEMLGYFDGTKTVPGLLGITYSSDGVAASRQNILSLLNSSFDDSLPAIDEQQMAAIMKQGSSYFRAAPVLCGIGQVPQYSTDTQ